MSIEALRAERDAAVDAVVEIAQRLEIDRPDLYPGDLKGYILAEVDRLLNVERCWLEEQKG